MEYIITQYGKPLDPSKYTIDEKNNTFYSNEDNIVLDFFGECRWIFKTGNNCIFNTGSYCTFITESNCTFKTLDDCIFKTYSQCTFNTGSNCTFKTGSNCTFKTGSHCNFKTGANCTFHTISNCSFNTLYNCTFTTGNDCTFHTEENSIFDTGSNCTFLIWYNGFIKCINESPIKILSMSNNVNEFTISNTIMYINGDKITPWTNNDLILNCKNPNYKDACNFFMKKEN